MPAAEGELAEVRPIYRKGDRVLVHLPSGYYGLVIRTSEVIDGELWFYGVGAGIMPFPAASIVRRLAPDEALIWPKLK
ncbi:MAG TPA: hypothetical protein VNZ44_04935 [Pyrinomonadaceae bacterium]|nr:hypothetical protein [Pyrinomonadaceae bacterium]